ncbi:MAG: GNVR domain-containing protein [Pseudomonadota bacterium]
MKGTELGPVTWPIETVQPSSRGGTLRDILNIIFRHRRIVSTFFIGTVITVLIAVLFFTKQTYVATAQLVVSPGREHISDMWTAAGGRLQPQLAFNEEEQLGRTTEMLMGRFLAERVVKAIGPTILYDDLTNDRTILFGLFKAPSATEKAITRFLKNVTAVPVGRSGLVNLSFRHESAFMAAKVVNVLGDLYVKRHLEVQKNQLSDAAIEEQFEVLKKKLRDSEDKLYAFKQRYGITATAKDEQDLSSRQVLTYRNGLNETRKQQSEVGSRLSALRGQLNQTSRNPTAASAVQQKLINLELQESELSQRVTPAHPTLRSLRHEIAAVRKQLGSIEGSKPYGTVATSQGGLFGELQQEMLHNEAEQKALAARAQSEESMLEENQRRLKVLEEISVEFNHLQQQAQLDDQNYRLFMTKMEESRISSAMDAKNIASVRVIEPAEPPPAPANAKKLLKIAMGLIFGGVGGVALAFLLHFVHGRLDTIEDVERSLELPVLASIPQLNWKSSPSASST